MNDFSADLATLNRIPAVSSILDVICRTTGMGFAAVARVTEDRWIACSVLDKINFGLKPGGELKVESTICHEIRQNRTAVVIDEVACDPVYRDHHTPRQYGFQSYISMPIFLPNGTFFGTLCSIDPNPARLNTPEVIGMFKLFAELIAFHIDASDRLAESESTLLAEREVSELREQFIGVLGHDLRNPLGAISMGAALLKQGQLDADQAMTVEMIRRSVARMSGLIDDTLDFTRGRLGGGIPLGAMTDESLESMLRHVIDEVRASWPEREIQAEFRLLEAVQYDPRRLAQLFTNLLANAMQHGLATRPVQVRAVSEQGFLELSVANDAEPIPVEAQQRLFEPFARRGSSAERRGLGLGLYIASEIAKSHRGTVRVSSTAEETRFTFRMPSAGPSLAPAKPALLTPPVSSPQASPRSGARILLIEDHADTLTALSRLLTRRGHTVTPAATAAAARTEYSLGRFDLIVSDLGLPDCSGLDLVAELRRSHSVPAIALTGYGLENGGHSLPGFDAHLTKPVDLEQLMKAVTRLALQNA